MAMPPPEAVIERGDGPSVVLVHGTATDALTWTIQLAQLRDFHLIAYHRRGTAAWPAAEPRSLTTADHADDLADLIDARAGGRAVVVGSSYGAVVTLELMARDSGRITAAVLCEPPLPGEVGAPTVPTQYVEDFEACLRESGPEAAAELFMRTVLTDAGWERMPRRWQERCRTMADQIVADTHALAGTRIDYEALSRLRTPVLLVGAALSASFYAPALDLLQKSLGRVERSTIPGAGHMMHGESPRSFQDCVRSFVRRYGNSPPGAS